MAGSNQIRLLVIEDVPQVAQYIRGLLNSQSQIKLLDVLADGSKVSGQAQQLRPDVIIETGVAHGLDVLGNGGNYRRQSIRHCFEQGEGETFSLRHQHEEVRGSEEERDVVALPEDLGARTCGSFDLAA